MLLLPLSQLYLSWLRPVSLFLVLLVQGEEVVEEVAVMAVAGLASCLEEAEVLAEAAQAVGQATGPEVEVVQAVAQATGPEVEVVQVVAQASCPEVAEVPAISEGLGLVPGRSAGPTRHLHTVESFRPSRLALQL